MLLKITVNGTKKVTFELFLFNNHSDIVEMLKSYYSMNSTRPEQT